MRSPMALAEQLKKQRKLLQLSQSSVAEKMGISQQMYAKYEKTGKMSTENLFLILNALGLELVTVDKFQSSREVPKNNTYTSILESLEDLSDD